MDQIRVDTGSYATACEKSPNKTLIDQWLNEGQSLNWISQQLKARGEKISDKSVGKYKRKREERIQQSLMTDPNYQQQISTINQNLVDGVAELKPINLMEHLNSTIEHCADLIKGAQDDDIKITKVQDLRMVQQTMLESIKVYGETVVQAQKYAKIEEDPSLLKPSVNLEVKDVLVEMLGDKNDTSIIDALRRKLNG